MCYACGLTSQGSCLSILHPPLLCPFCRVQAERQAEYDALLQPRVAVMQSSIKPHPSLLHVFLRVQAERQAEYDALLRHALGLTSKNDLLSSDTASLSPVSIVQGTGRAAGGV